MKKLVTLTLLILSTTLIGQTTWKLDASHSSVNFAITHFGISTMVGNFGEFDGSYTAEKEDLTDAKITFSINAKSVNTSNEARDEHLNSEDFFHTEKFDKITFESTSFSKGKDNVYELKGKMTMRGVTKTVSFKVMLGGIMTDPYGNTRAGFSATAIIDRTDFGVNGAQGGVGNDVNITVNAEFIKAK